ncbi:energy transducer TonB [Aquaticitalea lipolytica]|uniref:energy transducer TonB n=1 Tax=Aquaticitalea lipolytica TaxID=1247562 RepID=UPI0024BA9951|nr:energy transducer TonB [Aquaticitalea lipolytica]
MEVKKNPEVAVERNSKLYFAIGLCLTLLFSWQMLEYKSYKAKVKPIEIIFFEDSFEEEIPIKSIKTPATSAPQIAIKAGAIKVADNIADVNETFIESSETSQLDVIGKVTNTTGPISKIEDIKVVEVEEDIEVPFAVIESAPIFPGCEKGTKEEIKECFQNKIKEHVISNFIYPELAQDLGIHGKVYVLFAIDKNGVVTNIKTRGPDKILEKEAIRIISLLPKMTPGMQRGKAVKVTYSLPINFKYVER